MHILAPHIACVVREEEFPQAINSYSDIYILTKAGKIMFHRKLTHGRHVRVEVNNIPGYEVKPEEITRPLETEINFLPNGKIPVRLLDQILQFFKDVMIIKKADQEAMAHILWNPDKQNEPDRGYFIGIPDQIVSKASARYEFNHIKKGDAIIVDLHSHNTMNAFFSGTDDSDDKKGIYLSGVAGKLDEKEPALVWRMNVNEVKLKVSLEDIFEVPKSQVNVPTEWLEKVKTHTYSGPNYGYPGLDRGYIPGKGFPTAPQGKGERRNVGKRSGIDLPMDYAGMPNGAHWLAGLHDDLFNDAFQEPIGIDQETGKLITLDDLSPAQLAQLGIKRDTGIEEVDQSSLLRDMNEFYSYMYGAGALEAKTQIEVWLEELEGCDEILKDLMKQMYEKMSGEGQREMDKSGIS